MFTQDKDIKEKVRCTVEKAIIEAQSDGVFPSDIKPEIKLEYSSAKGTGNFTTNSVYLFSQKLGKPFEDVVKEIKSRIASDVISSTTVALGIHTNFTVSREEILNSLKEMAREGEEIGKVDLGKARVMLIDYSSPNIAKPFGIGHLRSTIIGQAVYNIYSFLGWKCIGDNHLGDWGTQFGKLIYQINKENLDLDSLNIDLLEQAYVRFHRESEANPQALDAAREYFRKLEAGDKQAKRIWEVCRKISLQEFDRIYEILGIKIDYTMGESFYEGKVKEIIDLASEKGYAQKSQGALVFLFPNNKLPTLVLQKSDGASTYFARDLAAVKYRMEEWHPDILVYEVGTDQELYMKQLFSASDLLGLAPENKFKYVGHGMIRGREGKFSTRKGQTIHLQEVLEEAVIKARALIDNVQKGKDLDEEEKENLAKAVGIGGIKYNDLSQTPVQDIIFDWDKILNFKGNSGPYIQYTYARCQSVIRKETSLSKKITAEKMSEKDDYWGLEEDIIMYLLQFKDRLVEAHDSFSPNIVCTYIYSLCQKYNYFYNECAILNCPDENEKEIRLNITKTVSAVIKICLSLLGVEAPEKM
ncbi:MAG TPA: arginine--tRNA ligase [Candidatus Pacearchaeota archaeon]|nr:arginine--tRNA ligase [Candidatus Pacearchaeota archaeon]